MPSFPDLLKTGADFLSAKGATAAAGLVITALASIVIHSRVELLEPTSKKEEQEKASRAASLMARMAQHPSTLSSGQIKSRQRQRHAMRRLEEAKNIWRAQKRTASWASFTNNLLMTAHYVIGATLATSFVQKSLSANLIGILGLVVVLASIIQNKYAPDVAASVARGKADILWRAIVRAEDSLAEANREKDDGLDFQRISAMLSDVIVSAHESLPKVPVRARITQADSLVMSRVPPFQRAGDDLD